MNDDDEIYAAPSEQKQDKKVQSVANLMRAFEQKGIIPIQMAKDDRHRATDSPNLVKPKPMLKPKLGSNESSLPNLPEKKSQLRPTKLPPKIALKPISSPVAAPKLQPTEEIVTSSQSKTLNGVLNHVVDDVIADEEPAVDPTRPIKSSGRSSIYPPNLTPQKNTQNDVNGNKIITYQKRPLPPIPDSAPPSKPSPINIDLSLWSGKVDPDFDPDEIYDDIASPEIEINNTNPTKTGGTPRESRPVSIIPDMTEDEELRELGIKEKQKLERRKDVITEVADDQEIYDDVASPTEDAIADEIYQEI